MNHRTPAEERLAARLAAAPAAESCTCGHAAADHHLNAAYGTRAYCNMCAVGACDVFRPAPPESSPGDLTADSVFAVLMRVHVHLFGQDGACIVCDLDIVTWSQAQGDAELDHIAIEGTRS